MRNIGRPQLKLIKGGLDCRTSLENLQIVAAPQESSPFRVDALAREEDTFLVLGGDADLSEPRDHPLRIYNEAYGLCPVEPGTVLARGQNPLMLLAIVHDLDREPTWREEWVQLALEHIMEEVRSRELRSLGLPLLGTRYGDMATGRFLAILRRLLLKDAPECLRSLWLVVPPGHSREVIDMFDSTVI